MTIKARQLPDGAIVQELENGATRPFTHHSDWERIDAMTDEEVEANALADADNPPLTVVELQQMRRGPIWGDRAIDRYPQAVTAALEG